MKLVNRQELLQMPKGTVFAKKDETFMQTIPIMILGDCFENDFTYIDLSSFYYGGSSEDSCNAYFYLEDELGQSLEMELAELRDGLFQDDEMYYILSKNEVQQIIDALTKSLKSAYN